MADVTTELVAHLVTLRAAGGDNPDSTTVLAKDIPVKRAAAAAHVQKDLNTVYEVAL